MTIRAFDGDDGSTLLRVKVSIEGSEPAIWRLLEVDSSLSLDRVHDILQTAKMAAEATGTNQRNTP